MERGGHGSLRLARRVIAGGDFAARFVELGLHVVGQFEVLFHVILVPRVELFQFRPREPRYGRFNFLNCAHGEKISKGAAFAKPVFLGRRTLEKWEAGFGLASERPRK